MIALLAALLATVTNTNPPTATYACSGVSYTVPFPYTNTGSAPDLLVTAGGAVLTYGTGYTINLASSTTTGTITLTNTCTGSVVISRATPLTQPYDLRAQGKYADPATTTKGLDRLAMEIQQVNSAIPILPLSAANGGLGISVPTDCGAGVLTMTGGHGACVALSGLAPPGTTGVLLQSTWPGSQQTGNIAISGNVGIGAVTGGGGSFRPLGSAVSGLGMYPLSYNTGNTSQGVLFEIFGGFNTIPAYQFWWNGGFSNSGYVSLIMNGCGSGGVNSSPCITTNPSGLGTPLYLGATLQDTVNNKLVFATGSTRTVAGNMFELNNGGTVKFGVDINGAVATSGAISSTGLTTTGPVTIGSGGTAISGSFRGTTTWNPGTITGGGGTATTNVTVTGAVTGADCIAGVTSPAPLSGYPVQCIVTATNTCGLMIVNQSASNVTFGSATFYCRVFNP